MVGNSDPKITVSRRKMLFTGGVVLVAAGIYAAFGTDWHDSKSTKADKADAKLSKAQHAKVDALLANFSYLKIERSDVEKYVKAYDKHFGSKRKKKLDGRFFTQFLLSSDFFLNGAKNETPVKYLALHNPARFPCQHPFARFD